MNQENQNAYVSQRYAYIFDFDGVLADSLDIIFECFRTIFKKAGMDIDYESYLSFTGQSPLDIIKIFCSKYHREEIANSVYENFLVLYKKSLNQTKPISCNVDLLRNLQSCGVAVGIASGSPQKEIRELLELFGIKVDVVVSAGEVAHGKPAPDVFLRAAELMSVDPKNCIVIEDGEQGVSAALKAGMKVLKYIELKH